MVITRQTILILEFVEATIKKKALHTRKKRDFG